MNEDLQALLCKILNESKDSGRVAKVLDCLKQNGVKNVDDLTYLEKSTLEKLGILSGEEIEIILNKKLRMELDEVLQEIFKDGKQERIQVISEILQENGATTAEDLKYFDWESLGNVEHSKNKSHLSDMEIEKIMYYLKKDYPEEYKEHKDKHDKRRELRMEKELAGQKAKAECELLKMKADTEKDLIDEPLKMVEIVGSDIKVNFNVNSKDRSGPENPIIVRYVIHLMKNKVGTVFRIVLSYVASRFFQFQIGRAAALLFMGDFFIFCCFSRKHP